MNILHTDSNTETIMLPLKADVLFYTYLSYVCKSVGSL